MDYCKNTNIGDISIQLACDDTISQYNVVVSSHGKVLEQLEYPGDRQGAMNEYQMLQSLLGKIAAIHPLVRVA